MVKIDETRPFHPVKIALITVSDSRTLETDTSGQRLAEMIAADGHEVVSREVIKDEVAGIVARLQALAADPEVDVVISSGGTGVTGRDVTPEAFKQVMEKEIEGFGELFRWISYQKVGTSTMQSRAIGGVVKGTYIFALPGSPSACKDGWMEILRFQLDFRHRPCNLVELMPRLQEHLAAK
ncbi:MAG TPA: molybdenum cofactor biosynthesis protein B [Kiloniellaceae bacterium]|nr:molybdenum cofactor biosynthesis protein B [Kiloniellaceae bacterium]